MSLAWEHTPATIHSHFMAVDMKVDRERLTQAMANDLPRFYPHEGNMARVSDYIQPRLKAAFKQWRDVGWLFTQAALSLPYITLTQHDWADGGYVIHTMGEYHRTSFNVDQQSIVYSVTFRIVDCLTMSTRCRVVMHAAFGWSADGGLRPCHVTVQRQLVLTPSPDAYSVPYSSQTSGCSCD
jgi:hypothetical protein